MMLKLCTRWIRRYTAPDAGIAITSRQCDPYPEVTGYYIPTLLGIGEHELARKFGAWLVSVQRPDGSIPGLGCNEGFAFDTGQVLRGWIALLERSPELEGPVRRACEWLIQSSDPATARLTTPAQGGLWSLGARGEVSEGIHLYTLGPLRRAGELLNEPKYIDFANRSLGYYLRHLPLTKFEQRNALSHFYAYIQEALLELGCEEEVRIGMGSVARYQQANGAVPAYFDAPWVCSTGLAQLALVWFRLGELQRANAALEFLGQLQNPSGGFFGSYGVAAEYFPAEEISWAVKYAVDASLAGIARHFDATVDHYDPSIATADGRVRAILSRLGDLSGKRVLDAGCGKGRYAGILKRRFPTARVTGLDISAEMLGCVPPGIETVQQSILDIPFENGSFDAVVCIEALEHVVHVEQAVGELARVLRPGGILVLIDKNREKLGALEIEAWETWFDAEEILRLLSSNDVDARAETIPYDEPERADGLFICWSGCKKAAPLPLSEPSSEEFLRAVPLDQVNARLLEAARRGDYALLLSHLLEQDRELLEDPHKFYSDQLFENRVGMQMLYEIFRSNASEWLRESRNRVLEIGSGGAFLAYKLAQLGYDVTALDASAPKILAHQLAHPERRPGLSIRFTLGLAEFMPFEDSQFDFVISQETLEHVFDLERTLREARRVAKPRSLFFHQVPDGSFADGSNHMRHFAATTISDVFSRYQMRADEIKLIPYLDGQDPDNLFVYGTLEKSDD